MKTNKLSHRNKNKEIADPQISSFSDAEIRKIRKDMKK